MERRCQEALSSGRICGRRVFILHVGRDGGSRAVEGADLCDQCWRRRRDRDRALRARPRVDRAQLVREKLGRDRALKRGGA